MSAANKSGRHDPSPRGARCLSAPALANVDANWRSERIVAGSGVGAGVAAVVCAVVGGRRVGTRWGGGPFGPRRGAFRGLQRGRGRCDDSWPDGGSASPATCTCGPGCGPAHWCGSPGRRPLKELFGGYCSKETASRSALPGEATTANPWRLGVGGCEHTDATAVGGDSQITVSWTAPADDGTFDITGYRVQWKTGSEEYDSSRQSADLASTTTSHTIGSLEAGTDYTVRWWPSTPRARSSPSATSPSRRAPPPRGASASGISSRRLGAPRFGGRSPCWPPTASCA